MKNQIKRKKSTFKSFKKEIKHDLKLAEEDIKNGRIQENNIVFEELIKEFF